jgi:hypothetical protein
VSLSVTPLFTLTEEECSLLPSTDDVEFYAEHGWYLSKKLFTDGEVDELVAASERYYAGERDRRLPLQPPKVAYWDPSKGDVQRHNDYVHYEHDGAGVQHIAFLTTDIVHAVRTFAGRGVGFAVTPSSYYDALAARLGPTDIALEALRPLGILVDRDHWGQMYQIFAKSTHIRRTYFVELIDRHGARTFGTSNIPALYAAKERELAEIRDTAGTSSA